MEVLFTSDRTVRMADEIVDYLLGPRLWIPRIDYPDFEGWVEKVHGQLKREEKRALIGIASGRVVGAVVYQRHLALPGALEVKNLTVRPDVQGRHVASFMLRNAEVEGSRDYGSSEVLVDAKVRNAGIRAFLLRNGYAVSGLSDLYGLRAGDDVLFRKRLSSRSR
jgi:ribosomal protein S18 acetylase RimI-like enzyme